MTSTFNPYHQWLGIPVGQTSATHYELLGLPPGEADGTRIEEAFYDRYAKVRRYQVGTHATVAIRILSELARAYQVLSDSDARGEYDRSLQPAVPDPASQVPVTLVWEAALDGSPDVEVIDAVRAARQLAWEKGGEAGLFEFAKRALRANLPVDDLREMLLNKAQADQRYVCGACYELIDSPARESTARVAVTSRQDVISPTLTISVTTGWLRYHADLQGSAAVWRGARHISSFHRGGVAFTVFAVVWLVLLLGVLAGFAFRPRASWWFAAGPAVASLAAVIIGSIYRPRFKCGIDVGWSEVIPQWFDTPATLEQVAFVAGLAHVSVGRGDRRQRTRTLDRICQSCESWAQSNLITSLQLSKIFRLVLLDRLREPELAGSEVRALGQLLDGCLAGHWPMETLYLVLRDGDWLSFCLPGVDVALRLRAYEVMGRAGLSPVDVLRLMRLSPGLARLLRTPDWEHGPVPSGRPPSALESARYFCVLRASSRRSIVTETISAFELAHAQRFHALAARPDSLLQSSDGSLVVSHQGIYLQGERLDDPETTTWRIRDRQHEILTGKTVIPWPASPVHTLRLVQKLSKWREQYLEPEAMRLAALPSSGNLPAAVVRMAGPCPACQRSLIFESGKTIAEPMGGVPNRRT